jgi:hypothetical protein
VIQAKGGSVKPESAQTVRAAFALPRNAVSLRPRPMARRKRAFVPERRFRIGFPTNEFRRTTARATARARDAN